MCTFSVGFAILVLAGANVMWESTDSAAGMVRIAPGNQTATLPPFHRPNVYFVDEAGLPISNSYVRILCFASATSNLTDDFTTVTDLAGRPKAAIDNSCSHVAAMRLHHTQPSGKPDHEAAYSIYSTSWAPYENDRIQLNRTEPISIVIPSTQPLVLFNVAASLAWEPAHNNQYVDNLKHGLAEASKYLYDATDGNMAFGAIDIDTNGEKWRSADIRVLPGNDVRPSAQVGGIVSQGIKYQPPNAPKPSTPEVAISTIYTPGAIFLGRNWNVDLTVFTRTNPKVKIHGALDLPLDGNWHEGIGARTIVHEWGHYALFLYDEYQTITGAKAYCIHPQNRNPSNLESNSSIMDSPYTASELWHSVEELVEAEALLGGFSAGACQDTRQYQFHHETDCETLERWYAIQQLPNQHELPLLECTIDEHGRGFSDIGLTKYLFDSQTRYIHPYIFFFPHHIFVPNPPLPLIPTLTATPASTGPGTVDAPVKAVADVGDVDISTQVYHLFRTDEIAGAEHYREEYGAQYAAPYDVANTANILHQGKVFNDPVGDPWTGAMTVLGAHPKIDDIRIFGEQYRVADGNRSLGESNRWYGRERVNGDPVSITLEQTPWRATMDAAYEVNSASQLIKMTVHLRIPVGGSVPNLPKNNPPIAQLCNPDSQLRCHQYWQQPMVKLAGGGINEEIWKAVFHPVVADANLGGVNELPRYGIVRVKASYPEFSVPGSELIRWYRISGVGPGGHNADAPGPDVDDAVITLQSVNELIRHCNQVAFMPSAHYNALQLPPIQVEVDRRYVRILGQAYDIATRLPNAAGECSKEFGLTYRPGIDGNIILSIAYQDPLSRDGEIKAEDLDILYYDPSGEGTIEEQHWTSFRHSDILKDVGLNIDTENNRISAPFVGDGVYAVFWNEQ